MDKDMINYQHFSSLELVVARVQSASFLEGADKLLVLSLDAGPKLGLRQVVSGIKQFYDPEQIIGELVIYLANLEPRSIRGEISQGMILASVNDQSLSLLKPDKEMMPGDLVS